jgi:hypothetical protein
MTMAYVYPLDPDDLVSRVRQRGADFAKHLGIDDKMRADEVLTTLAWNLSTVGFPRDAKGEWHGRVDLGLPDLGDQTLMGADVAAVGDGEVVFVDGPIRSEQDFDLGRLIIRHQTPDGDDFFVHYYHLEDIFVIAGEKVASGDVIGTVGWHGDFPHLSFGAASLQRIGGDDDLVPEHAKDDLPDGDAAANTLRIKVEALDGDEWPVEELKDHEGYVFNPIELVRFCRGEPYLHDIGSGSRHAVKPAPASDKKKLEPDTDHKIEVSLLKSEPLKASPKLVQLAHDRKFEPLTQQEPDQDAVKAIQKALQSCQYDLGRFGPDHDGIDGAFGGTTERVLQRFQDVQLRQMLKQAGEKGILGLKESDLRTDGKLDWLTLVGLDLAAAAHASAPPPPKPKPTQAPPPPRPAPKPAPPPSAAAPTAPSQAPAPASGATSGGDWVFDGASKQYSLRMGMKMYKALLDWEWADGKGVRYSSCVAAHYGSLIPKDLKPEWPSSGFTQDGTVTVDGQPYALYNCFRISWKGSNYTNCCNSQIAALTVALGGGTFGVKKPDGTVTYNIRQPKKGEKDVLFKAREPKGKLAARSALAIFEQTWVDGTSYLDENDKRINAGLAGGMMYALRFLGIGDIIFEFTTTPEEFLKMRLGDLGSYDGHAWMVGDVRYRVSFQESDKEDCVLDQSSFIDGPAGTLVKLGTKKTEAVSGRRKVNAADCDWVIANEVEFERRITAFLSSVRLKCLDGVERQVKKIEVANWRVFSANGNKGTAHAKQYTLTKDKGWVEDEKKTKALAWVNGVTRPWWPQGKISLGRFYRQV